MSKHIYKVTPVNGYDIEALEGWLEDMAAKGLYFSMTAGPITLFERSDRSRSRSIWSPFRVRWRAIPS